MFLCPEANYATPQEGNTSARGHESCTWESIALGLAPNIASIHPADRHAGLVSICVHCMFGSKLSFGRRIPGLGVLRPLPILLFLVPLSCA